jgi:hypothetical protein
MTRHRIGQEFYSGQKEYQMPRNRLTYALALALCLVLSPALVAEELVCDPSIEGTGPITEKVKVPEACVLVDREIRGNIELEEGAVLTLNGGTLYGNIECDGDGTVILMDNPRIWGNIDEDCDVMIVSET